MKRMIAMTLAGMIGLVGLTGCPPTEEEDQQQPTQPDRQQPTQPQQQPQQPDTQPGQQDEPLGVERMDDQEIARQIEDRLQQEPQLTPEGREIQLSVDGGQVTIEGHVQSQQESQQVERIAADVAGQDNVDNQLEVRDQQQLDDGQFQQQDPQLQDDQFDQQP